MELSKSIKYDLSRSNKRLSVPKANAHEVPVCPGVYIIYQTNEIGIEKSILDIGKAGLRDSNGKSKPVGLRGRIASSVAHSASQKMADAIGKGLLPENLKITWFTTNTDKEAKLLESGLINLFFEEFKCIPKYNSNKPKSENPYAFNESYLRLKEFILKL